MVKVATWLRLTMASSDALFDYARDITGDTTRAIGVLVSHDIKREGNKRGTYNSSRAGRLRLPPIRHGREEEVSE